METSEALWSATSIDKHAYTTSYSIQERKNMQRGTSRLTPTSNILSINSGIVIHTLDIQSGITANCLLEGLNERRSNGVAHIANFISPLAKTRV